MEIVMTRRSRRLLVAVAIAIAVALGATADLSAVDFPLRRVVDVADFDRDGHLDLLVTPEQGHPLYLVRQVNGSYSPEFELSNADSLEFDSSVAASDLNGDGLVDVAWTDGSRTAIYLAAGSTSGLAPLAAPILRVTLTTGQLGSLLAADLTRDGRGDLLATGTAGVYLFAGPLSALSPTVPPRPLPGSPGDAGKAIVASRTEARIPEAYIATADGIVRMFSDTSGAWRFSPALSGPVQDFAVGNADGDGLPDLVTIEPPDIGSTRPMQVLLRLATPSGGFGNPDVIAQGTALRVVAIGDADGTERPDVVYAQHEAGDGPITNEVSLLAGRDGGGFYAAERVGADFPGSQEYLRLVDLDGKPPAEVVFSGNPAGVRAGAGQLQLSRPNLQVSASAPASVARRRTMNLAVAVANRGAQNATDVTLRVGLPAVLSPLAGGTPSECAVSGPALLCRLGNLSSGTNRQLQLGVRAQQTGRAEVPLSARGLEADVNIDDNDVNVAIVVTEEVDVPTGIRKRGTAKADRLLGSAYADVLEGRAGRDHLFGYAGNDILVGGLGKDVIEAGRGNDTIRAREKTRDIVRCGPGTDTVTADKVDALTNCENVSRR
jgi:Ca2+-binding RTX toxin-like protein